MRREHRTGSIIPPPLTILMILALLIAPSVAGNTATFTGEIPAGEPPVAAFSGTPTFGSAPLTVVFTDHSTGVISSWAWDFDNNGVVDSTEQNPTWTYVTPGFYTVKLTVTGPYGSDNEVKTNYIVVKAPVKPVADFYAVPTCGYAPLTVQFTDLSANHPTAWKWEYRKGSGSWTQFSTMQNPSYTFTMTGTYSIRLTVTNAAGSSTLTKMNYISVTAPPKPVADFTVSPTSGLPPLTVQFTDRSTHNPTSWKWEYRKSGTSTWVQFSTAQHPSYTFTTIGTYSIRLTVGNAGGTDTRSKIDYITVGHCGLIIPYFTASPDSGQAPLSVQFEDRSLGSVDMWEWDFQNDGTWDSTLQNPVYTYTKKGKYSVKLRVTNACTTGMIIRYNYIYVK